MADRLVHDSEDWRAARDAQLAEWVGNPDAVRWLLDFFDVCELFDDLIDKDKPIDDGRVVQALWEALVDMPGNPFFIANAGRLLPVISMGINCWLDANDLEADQDLDSLHFSYVMRAAYMQVLPTVVEIVRGREAMRAVSLDIVRFFGEESFSEYAGKLRSRGTTQTT